MRVVSWLGAQGRNRGGAWEGLREMGPARGFGDVLISICQLQAVQGAGENRLTGVGVQACVGESGGELARVDTGRSRRARLSRRALCNADLESSPLPNKKEFIVLMIL